LNFEADGRVQSSAARRAVREADRQTLDGFRPRLTILHGKKTSPSIHPSILPSTGRTTTYSSFSFVQVSKKHYNFRNILTALRRGTDVFAPESKRPAARVTCAENVARNDTRRTTTGSTIYFHSRTRPKETIPAVLAPWIPGLSPE